MAADTREAVTLSEAASELGLTEERVGQLLKTGPLTGPIYGSGRAPRNAPRVWVDSLEAEVARRAALPTPATRTALSSRGGDRVERLETLLERQLEAAAGREDAARAATQRAKVLADEARRVGRAERAHHRKVVRELVRVATLLEEQQELTERMDRLSDGYSDVLTQLLSPANISSLHAPKT